MKVKVILNPYANRWRAQSREPAIRAALDRSALSYDLTVTTKRLEATHKAKEAALAGYDAIVAAGGDGTVSEVVNGLIQAAGEGQTAPLGVLPVGTGNDFNDMAGLPRSLDEAVAIIQAGATRQIDAGRVNERYFNNNCALAMEPVVTIENERIQRLTGNVRYLVALAKSLLRLETWHMHLVWDDGEYEGQLLLLSVCNSPRTGGVFRMAPDAIMDDGFFDIVYAPEMPRWKVMTILPRLFSGTHISQPIISHRRTRRLSVVSDPGTPIHADGEVIARSARRVEYEVLPKKITLLSPTGK